jgi:hypothetical protein
MRLVDSTEEFSIKIDSSQIDKKIDSFVEG